MLNVFHALIYITLPFFEFVVPLWQPCASNLADVEFWKQIALKSEEIPFIDTLNRQID